MSKKLRSLLTWEAPPARASAAAAVSTGQAEEQVVDIALDLAPRERAAALLHVASEVEHALMVQYLYAAYSLDEDQTPERRKLVKNWRSVILQIAREEMAHLATVQNMLTLIGGPLCFEREDYPLLDPQLWPFPLALEPLTKDSLAKYVLAEMPSKGALEKLGLAQEFEKIEQRLRRDEKLSVNRVGELYGRIIQLFTEGPMIQGPIVPGVTKVHPFVATVDIQAGSLGRQVTAGAWGLGQKDLLILTGHDRPSALDALTQVSIQGEGPLGADDQKIEAEFKSSHCWRFLEIYRAFPEPAEWRPARATATNPTTDPAENDPCRRIAGAAEDWANLANLRYKMLLLYLKHSFYVESDSGSRSPRGALVSWAFGEMYNLRSLAEILMGMPLRPHSDLRAGPPFQMPYTLDLPSRSADRWRTHRDQLMASIDLTGRMLRNSPEHETYLRGLRSADITALEQVNVLVGA